MTLDDLVEQGCAQRHELAHPDEDAHRAPPVNAEGAVLHVDADGWRWVGATARLTPEQAEATAQRLAALILRNLKR